MSLIGKSSLFEGGGCGENAAAKGILCNSISVLIYFSVTLCITCHGIDD